VPSGPSPRATSGVTVAIARDPALVRTVRLVAAAVARRTGRDEEFVEEVRLAVGEACALLIGHEPMPSPATEDPVTVAITIEDELMVEVSASGEVAVEDPPHSDIDGVEPWALLRGLIDSFAVARDGARTCVSMAWPLA
jgi:anti-sigma regulatory factor (Ser/Thr protein kinase)